MVETAAKRWNWGAIAPHFAEVDAAGFVIIPRDSLVSLKQRLYIKDGMRIEQARINAENDVDIYSSEMRSRLSEHHTPQLGDRPATQRQPGHGQRSNATSQESASLLTLNVHRTAAAVDLDRDSRQGWR